MPISSAVGRGQVQAGETALACTLAVTQTGPLQLTIHAGTYTHVDGTVYPLGTDAVLDLVPDPAVPTHVGAWLGRLGGAFEILVMTWTEARPSEPPGWVYLAPLILEFDLPPAAADLGGLDIAVLTVVPGTRAAEEAPA